MVLELKGHLELTVRNPTQWQTHEQHGQSDRQTDRQALADTEKLGDSVDDIKTTSQQSKSTGKTEQCKKHKQKTPAETRQTERCNKLCKFIKNNL